MEYQTSINQLFRRRKISIYTQANMIMLLLVYLEIYLYVITEHVIIMLSKGFSGKLRKLKVEITEILTTAPTSTTYKSVSIQEKQVRKAPM